MRALPVPPTATRVGPTSAVPACPPPAGMKWPTCNTMGPQWPHAASDTNEYPTHFYRIQFKRMDGDGIKTHWREWYPWMVNLAVAQKEHAK